MNATSGGNAATSVGYGTFPANLQAQVAFYSRINQIADQVNEGKHPIIKLPPGALSSFMKQGSILDAPLSKFINSDQTFPIGSYATNDHNTNIPSTKHTITDSIILTRSDFLLNAELLLKRQRLERELQHQVDRKKLQGRDRELALEGPQRFNPQEAFAQAIKLIIPVSGFGVTGHNQSITSCSFDENSYYSSKASSWSEEDGEYRPEDAKSDGLNCNFEEPRHIDQSPATCPLNIEPFSADTKNLPDCEPSKSNPAVSVLKTTSLLKNNVEQLVLEEPPKSFRTQDMVDVRDESYSPPAADAFKTFPPPPISEQFDTIENGHATLPRRPSERELFIHSAYDTQTTQTVSPKLLTFPVVTSKIPIPDAPNPARVSPLAVDRSREGIAHNLSGNLKTRIERNEPSPIVIHYNGPNEPGLSNQVPGRRIPQDILSLPRQSLQNPRKRGRDPEVVEQMRRPSGKRIARSPARSPEILIKAEPSSPPLLSNEPPRRLILRDDGHAEIEVITSQQPDNNDDARQANYSTVPSIRTPSYAYHGASNEYNFHTPSEFTRAERQYPIRRIAPSETYRILSSSPAPGSRRAGHDLRRATTNLQHMHRPQSAALTSRHAATSSAVQAVRHYPPHQPTRFSPGEVTAVRSLTGPQSMISQQDQYSPNEIRALRAYHQPRQHLEYSPTELQREPPRVLMERPFMGPPLSTRRIVVDQYGNEYIAVPTSTRSQYSVPPEDHYSSQRAASYQPMSANPDRFLPVAEPSYDFTTF